MRMTANNLKFRGLGNEVTLWNKVMKEVKLGRFAGPFVDPPFEHFIQSPIGLVPKDNGKDTRLIFHLSYPRGTGTSVNDNIPSEECTVKYPDFSEAIKLCLDEGRNCNISRSDVQAAFRNAGIRPEDFKYLLMRAKSPFDNKFYWFVDKCLPFGSKISCKIFQRISNGVKHLVKWRTGKELVNYLDDYLFAALMKYLCDGQVKTFLQVCKEINLPVALEKTFWGCTLLTFLGLLIDTVNQTVSIPCEKVERAKLLISSTLEKKSKKLTLVQLQKICGFLNFLGRAVVPGRAFTRRLYMHTAGKNGKKLKPHHHIRISHDMREDLKTWLIFLKNPVVFCRPFLDFSTVLLATEIDMASDATTNPKLGMGAICGKSWIFQQWDERFIRSRNPSIQYLELFAVLAGVIKWIHRFRNKRIVLFCDNNSVCGMINSSSSSCSHCMNLVRILVLFSMTENCRIYAKHISSKSNRKSDLLSRLRISDFLSEFGNDMEDNPSNMPELIWPMNKVWN